MTYSIFDLLSFMRGGDPTYLIIMAAASGVSWLVSNILKSRFKKYSQIPIDLTGEQIAKMMLDDAGISDVQIISVGGQLTDHYNPGNKTVNLSQVVHSQSNAAAAAVAAHEVGHAIQHASSYHWLKMRSNLVPMLGFGSRMAPMIIMGGLMLMSMGSLGKIGELAAIVGLVLFSVTTLFAFVTLPVEFDASKRALRWIEKAGVMGSMEHSKAKSALNAAAMTYVVGALTSLATLVYFIIRFQSRRGR